MAESWIESSKASVTESISCSVSKYHSSSRKRSRQRNIIHLLAQREVSPQTKHQAKKIWTKSPNCAAGSIELRFWATDSRHDLFSWVESQSLHRWSAKNCPLVPTLRSTIAAAFSPDERTLVSTHGDHTVKIIDWQTGECLKVLSGHRRTPWVVRYHPLYSDTVASGSLDHEVCLWDAKTSRCIGSHYFYKSISSIAFHAKGELLAVASGHKLFMWDYNKRGEASSPPMILRTRRSLRAVQFHPHGAPYLLTAEGSFDLEEIWRKNKGIGKIPEMVLFRPLIHRNGPRKNQKIFSFGCQFQVKRYRKKESTPNSFFNSYAQGKRQSSELTLATSSGYSNYPSTIYFASRCYPHLDSKLLSRCIIWPAYLKNDGSLCLLGSNLASDSIEVQHRLSSSGQNSSPSDAENEHPSQLVTPMDVCTEGVTNVDSVSVPSSTGNEMQISRGQSIWRMHSSNDATNLERFTARNNTHMSYLTCCMPNPGIVADSRPGVPCGMPVDSSITSSGLDTPMFLRHTLAGPHHHNNTVGSRSWEMPFFQGWMMAQSRTGLRPAFLNTDDLRDLAQGISAESVYLASELTYMFNFQHDSSLVPTTTGSFGGPSRRTSNRHLMASISGFGSSRVGTTTDEAGDHATSLGIGPEFTTSLLAPDPFELPCTVKLSIWRHNIKDPCVTLESEACRMTISHAVLCSEMGTHFSPCGRFLVACVACLLPQTEGDHRNQLPMQYDYTRAGTSPTHHPLPSHRVIYELRVYSLEEATFGTVLVSRAMKAAHCLTSIQFSPTSEHILLAYGRRHNSLLRSIVMDGETMFPVYAALEVYRVSDMELVGVLPSAEDEVNVACFHPSPGAGLVYGTKEGKLRTLQYNGVNTASMRLNF